MAITTIACTQQCPPHHRKVALSGMNGCVCIPTTVERIVTSTNPYMPGSPLPNMGPTNYTPASYGMSDATANGYTQAVIEAAVSYLHRGCKEETSNRGVCVDEIKRIYGDTTPLDEAWCAQFVYAMHKIACFKVRRPITLPKTKGARRMLDLSRGVFRIDRLAEPGDVYYRKSSSGTGHLGLCVSVGQKGIMGIEGNVDNEVGARTYEWMDITDPRIDMMFIHVGEKYAGSHLVSNRLEFY